NHSENSTLTLLSLMVKLPLTSLPSSDDEEGLKALAARINAFAVSEDLPAHGECVLSRFVKDPYDKATLREQEKEAGLR
ncbi:hypothetical protein AAA019_09985, partial [Bifidobacterium longum]